MLWLAVWEIFCLSTGDGGHNLVDENDWASAFRSVRNDRIHWCTSSHSAISTYTGARQQAAPDLAPDVLCFSLST